MRWLLLLSGLAVGFVSCAAPDSASHDSLRSEAAATQPLASAEPAGSAAPSASAESSRSSNEVSVPLSTSDWRPGDAGMAALIRGRLAVTPDGCVHMGRGTERVDVVWPADYTASRELAGSVAIYDPNGVMVAKTGHEVEASGGYLPADDELLVCRAGGRHEAAFVNSALPPMNDAGSNG